MNKIFSVLAFLSLLIPAAKAEAHFGMAIPSLPVIMTQAQADNPVTFRFWHPFENQGMNLEKPASILLYRDGKPVDLTDKLQPGKERGFSVWTLPFKAERPGLNTFVMTPQPYWEPAEDCFIVHYTKVAVPAFGMEDGWDEPLGLPVEIVPLARPYAQYAGNLFQGTVMRSGKPVPGAEVEVEFYPGPDKAGVAPNDLMTTQTVKADENGVFSYAAPFPGWWGFAALMESDAKMDREGTPKSVELGGVIWVRFEAAPVLKGVK